MLRDDWHLRLWLTGCAVTPFAAHWVGKRDVRDQTIAEEGIDAVAGAIEELVGDHKIERLVLFLERSHGRDRNDSLDTQLLEAVDVGAEVQFAGQ